MHTAHDIHIISKGVHLKIVIEIQYFFLACKEKTVNTKRIYRALINILFGLEV